MQEKQRITWEVAIIVAMVLLFITVLGFAGKRALVATTDILVDEIQTATTPVCIGVGRYEQVTGDLSPVVLFDSCTGRYYRYEFEIWVIQVPAVPAVPPTAREREEWQAEMERTR